VLMSVPCIGALGEHGRERSMGLIVRRRPRHHVWDGWDLVRKGATGHGHVLALRGPLLLLLWVVIVEPFRVSTLARIAAPLSAVVLVLCRSRASLGIGAVIGFITLCSLLDIIQI
jgi:hypothetical protein